MRIATSQVFANNSDSIGSTSNRLYELQQQLSTGKKIIRPSDDPLGATEVLKLTSEIDQTEQFKTNIDFAKRRMNIQETTLKSINTNLDRIKELAIQANVTTLTDADRDSIAKELDGIEKTLFGLMNTQDVQGEYLFSGFQGQQEAYSYNAATDSYVFNGDEGQRFIEIGTGVQVAATDSGSEIFEKVPGVLTFAGTAAPAFSSRVVSNHTEFKNFADNLGPATITFNTGANTYSVTDKNGAPVSGGNPAKPLTNITYAQGDYIEFGGSKLKIDNPANGALTVNTQTERNNVLNMVHKFSAALKSTTASNVDGIDKINEAASSALVQLEGIQTNNLSARGELGGRLRQLDQQSEINTEFLLFTKQARSAFEDVDYAKTISDFTLERTSLNAAYSSFAQIQNLSLFNFINN